MALIKAYKKYKKEDCKFSSYAYFYILGDITKYIRNKNGLNINYLDCKIYKEIKRFTDAYRSKYGYNPTYEVISKELGIKTSKLIDLDSSFNFVVSIDSDINNFERNIKENDRNLDLDLINLRNSLDLLSLNERRLINYRYFDGYSQSDCAKLMNINQVKVSRLENKILKKLKSYN